jgi:hypothetical protein
MVDGKSGVTERLEARREDYDSHCNDVIDPTRPTQTTPSATLEVHWQDDRIVARGTAGLSILGFTFVAASNLGRETWESRKRRRRQLFPLSATVVVRNNTHALAHRHGKRARETS